MAVQGWMKNTILSNNRTFRVMVPMANLYVRADIQSPVRAELEERVVGNLNFCRIDGWCRADLPEASGWILAQDVWGVMPGEEVLRLANQWRIRSSASIILSFEFAKDNRMLVALASPNELPATVATPTSSRRRF